jgi:hypothetical protein
MGILRRDGDTRSVNNENDENDENEKSVRKHSSVTCQAYELFVCLQTNDMQKAGQDVTHRPTLKKQT